MEEYTDDEIKTETKVYLIEYGTVRAQYQGIEDIAVKREDYDRFITEAADMELRLIAKALHLSTERREQYERIVLEAHHELLTQDYGKGIEGL